MDLCNVGMHTCRSKLTAISIDLKQKISQTNAEFERRKEIRIMCFAFSCPLELFRPTEAETSLKTYKQLKELKITQND